jgi:hypothetical protein
MSEAASTGAGVGKLKTPQRVGIPRDCHPESPLSLGVRRFAWRFCGVLSQDVDGRKVSPLSPPDQSGYYLRGHGQPSK